jgi:hypothetical protein
VAQPKQEQPEQPKQAHNIHHINASRSCIAKLAKLQNDALSAEYAVHCERGPEQAEEFEMQLDDDEEKSKEEPPEEPQRPVPPCFDNPAEAEAWENLSIAEQVQDLANRVAYAASEELERAAMLRQRKRDRDEMAKVYRESKRECGEKLELCQQQAEADRVAEMEQFAGPRLIRKHRHS